MGCSARVVMEWELLDLMRVEGFCVSGVGVTIVSYSTDVGVCLGVVCVWG